ncbi:MAG TPA: 16S rRNA (cytosine(1402)-N(4))-methyltransferase RsmH [Blastocatellia bacterium]|nr:16S rRNA (cytosine(1402)-N(4))-methyltransferase RsmH [Blastocatellia bacterium]
MNQEIEEVEHLPVMVGEVVDGLDVLTGGTFVDCTVGLGGHSKAILDASPDGKLIGIDRDPDALEIARKRLPSDASRIRLVHGNFKGIKEILAGQPVEWIGEGVSGILADLGVSSLQLDRAERGFSFQSDASLDMRMDPTSGETAAEIIERLDERELADLIFNYGQEPGSRRIARAIVKEREKSPIETTKRLADIVVRALHKKGYWRVHPATKTFQALRIAVNDELNGLEAWTSDAVDCLKKSGRLAIITFHSLEDRIVKRSFQFLSGSCICPPGPKGLGACVCGATKRVNILTRRPIVPSADETAKNARARSAKLRLCEKI